MPSTLLALDYRNPVRTLLGDAFFDAIPSTPGVYYFLDADGEPLYIGKAKDLRRRLMSYRLAKPGPTPAHTLEMLELARRIVWEERRGERQARERELELLQAIRPPYNLADTEPGQWLYVELARREDGKTRFRLTGLPEETQGKLFGCFKHRGKVRAGYTALLRLLHAAEHRQPRFTIPARLCRPFPPYFHALRMRDEWHGLTEKFLAGESVGLLRELTGAMLENEHIQPFQYYGLQEDLDRAREFYRRGPRETRRLRRENGGRSRLVTQEQLEGWIVGSRLR